MTNRVNGLVITLDKDYRDDDVQVIIDAIKMIRGVADVDMNIVEMQDYLNRNRVRYEIEGEIYKAIGNIFDDKTKL